MSKIYIKELDKPDLNKTKMNCDGVIHEKLTKFPMVEEAFSTSSFNVVCGKMGQGKSSLVVSMVKTIFKKVFENIFVFMPQNSRESIEGDLFGKHLPSDQLFDTLTEENLTYVYKRLQEESKEKHHSLIIIDDFQASLKSKEILLVLQKIVTKMRHLRVTIFLLQQNFQALHKPLRELCSNVIIFNLGKSQLEKIFDELVQIKKEKFEKIIKLCFIEPHDWLLINLNKSRSVYRMGDLVVIGDED